MHANLILLGVNIDHVASLRQARGTRYPEPLQAALICEQAGADAITIHLREDRRHIQDRDVWLLKDTIQTRMNLELAVTDEMLGIALEVRPEDCCLVPERREELTTEGGLDVIRYEEQITAACQKLGANGTRVSLFIDADFAQLDAAARTGAPVVEIHTGHYGDALSPEARQKELTRIAAAVEHARGLGFTVNAGHGLDYHNVTAIAALADVRELNIGHAIVSESVFTGLDKAVARMKQLMVQARVSG
ncbi:MAG: pyridoxine 5'-phosphate synthase [Gammaproteobacteria bacterium]